MTIKLNLLSCFGYLYTYLNLYKKWYFDTKKQKCVYFASIFVLQYMFNELCYLVYMNRYLCLCMSIFVIKYIKKFVPIQIFAFFIPLYLVQRLNAARSGNRHETQTARGLARKKTNLRLNSSCAMTCCW